jgi:hypothetical protein
VNQHILSNQEQVLDYAMAFMLNMLGLAKETACLHSDIPNANQVEHIVVGFNPLLHLAERL